MDELKKIRKIGFTVDAGLIQRLGYELVGRAETAVSELIKNSYDADATIVDVDFIEPFQKGGILIISDNGIGMTEEQLINGFMRISSTDKVHNPTSLRFKRTKAGKKGIGRFAAQRLGEQLTIITQTQAVDFATKLTIDWNQYLIDNDLTSITFPLEIIDKKKTEGTTLIIRNLREKWTDAAIMRIYRYVLDLFQPDYLSERSKTNNLAVQNEKSFKVNFYQVVNGERKSFLNEQISIFDKSLAVFEGFIDKKHRGIISVKSESLNLNDTIEIRHTEDYKEFMQLSDVHFKIHYFIYNRTQYYKNGISNIDLNKIQELSKTASGVKLYRNGFRVLPYGEVTDDWTNIDRRWSSESGRVNVPLSNKNLFGFVEIIDPNGTIFEETASREGLIENESFRQLSDFINKSLTAARGRIVEKITTFKFESEAEDLTQESEKKNQTTQEMFETLKSILDEHVKSGGHEINNPNKDNDAKTGHEIINKLADLIEEAGMLRVLAGLGLTIGEFTHEIKQFQPSVYGHISKLNQLRLNTDAQEQINGIKMDFDNLFGYTKYFSTTISQNTNREKEPVDLLAILDVFHKTIKNDLSKNRINFEIEEFDFDVMTIPMHKSEWSSILYNLYTNSRKAIKRANREGSILVEVGIDDGNTFIKFHDNGDGIPEENKNRIFNPFFSTSTPASYDAPNGEQLVGTGLGLKIVKDIITSYKGSISLVPPNNDYSTCFRITIPQDQKILYHND